MIYLIASLVAAVIVFAAMVWLVVDAYLDYRDHQRWELQYNRKRGAK
jgi:hypothetical protein